jgi:hypothetical protein
MQNIQNALQPFVDTASGESAFARLGTKASSAKTADIRSVQSVKRALQPDEWNTVVASTLSDIGKVVEGGRSGFSPTKYAEWFEKLPEVSRDVLFGKKGSDLRDQLEKLTKVAAEVGQVEKMAKPTGGAGELQATAAAGTVVGSAVMLNIGVMLRALGTLGGEAVVGSVLTSPNALRWLNKLGDVKDQGALIKTLDAMGRAAKGNKDLWQLHQIAQKVATGKVEAPPMGGEDVVELGDEFTAEPLGDSEVEDSGLAEPLNGEALSGEDGAQEVAGSDEIGYEPLGGSGASLGDRNNNPGNIRDGDYAKSQPGYVGPGEGGFAMFDNADSGAAAQENLLTKSYLAKGVDTVDKIVERYNPRADKRNTPDVMANYKRYVADKIGVGVNDTLSENLVPVLARAMREFETGNRS